MIMLMVLAPIILWLDWVNYKQFNHRADYNTLKLLTPAKYSSGWTFPLSPYQNGSAQDNEPEHSSILVFFFFLLIVQV